MRRAALIAALALLAGCSVPERYTGTLTRTSGTCSTTTASLTRRGPAISFATNDGVLTLAGTTSPDGTAHATLATQGIDHKPYIMELAGHLTDTEFTGRFRSPTCRADVMLQVK